MDWGNLLSLLPTLLTSLAGAGPWGIAAMVLGGGGIVAAVWYFIKRMNATRDATDAANAGADAGTVAQDLKNQAQSNNEYIKNKMEQHKGESGEV